MKLTPFGLAVREIRLRLGLTLKDMADSLETSSAYVSAIEFGEKALTVKHLDQTVEYFSGKVSAEELGKIRVAGLTSMKSIPIEGLNMDSKELVAAFARRLGAGQGVPEDVSDWIKKGVVP